MKFEVFNELPLDYNLVWNGDFKENKKLLMLLNVGGIILIIPFTIIYFVYFINKVGNDYGLFLSFLLFIPTVFIHELIHAIFFKMNKNVQVKFAFHGFAASCSAPNQYVEKKHYFLVGIAPAIIINLGLIIALFFASGLVFGILYWLLVLHFCGCIGDFYIIFKLIKLPKDLLIRDYGIGMEFYSKEDK